MKSTQSNTVELKGIYAAEEQILTKVAPGPSFDPVVFGIFAYFEILLAATYHGIGKRALEIGIQTKLILLPTNYAIGPNKIFAHASWRDS